MINRDEDTKKKKRWNECKRFIYGVKNMYAYVEEKQLKSLIIQRKGRFIKLQINTYVQ